MDGSSRPEDFADHPSVKMVAEIEILDNFNFERVSYSCVQEILDSLNRRKAVGVDGISPLLRRFSRNHTWPLEWNVVI